MVLPPPPHEMLVNINKFMAKREMIIDIVAPPVFVRRWGLPTTIAGLVTIYFYTSIVTIFDSYDEDSSTFFSKNLTRNRPREEIR